MNDGNPNTCSICQRRAGPLAVTLENGATLHVCANVTCVAVVQGSAAHGALDKFEAQALEDGGDAAGAYLESLGRTDLAKLAADEWTEFLRLVLTGYGESMRTRLLTSQAPF